MTLAGALSQDALSKARAIALPQLPDGSYLDKQTWHWTVEQWGWNAPKFYNWVLDKQNGVWVILESTPIVLNATAPPQPGYAAHAWEDNSHNAGVGINALSSYPDGRGATPSDFGPQPLELAAVELLCAFAGRLQLEYTIDGAAGGTHAEDAIAKGYFPTQDPADGVTRWDLARLEASSAPLSEAEAFATGAQLRARAQQYYAELATGVIDR
jgi:hypothetical protein